MGVIESIKQTSDKIVDKGETYYKKSEEYYKLKIFQQLTISISLVAKAFLIGGLFLLGLFFLAFALAIALGNWLDSQGLGYLIVGGIFIITTVVIYLNRKHISNKIVKILSTKFFN